jgi:hypothetical protein
MRYSLLAAAIVGCSFVAALPTGAEDLGRMSERLADAADNLIESGAYGGNVPAALDMAGDNGSIDNRFESGAYGGKVPCCGAAIPDMAGDKRDENDQSLGAVDVSFMGTDIFADCN